jgi:hypothetical protein
MLGVDGREDPWCAACAAVDGSVELRVGEPARGRLVRRRDREGEAWLRDHGFRAIQDAWALPVPAATSDEQCAATLEAALAGALGVDAGARLGHILTHPGLLDGIEAPPADAPLELHLAAAFQGLVRAGEGRYSIDSGRPGALRAWVWVDGEELLVEREVPAESWREPLTPEGADAAAAELARRERDDRPGADHEPWLFGYITNGDGAG